MSIPEKYDAKGIHGSDISPQEDDAAGLLTPLPVYIHARQKEFVSEMERERQRDLCRFCAENPTLFRMGG